MRNIVLVGFMGTGKSAVGRYLASSLEMSHVDMDHVLTQRQSRSIARIFEEEGEPYFRKLERSLVSELAAQSNLIISTGGGVVLDPENICEFERTGTVICLTASVQTIMDRVRNDKSRPLLQGDEREERIQKLLAERQPFYGRIGHQVATDGCSAEEIAEQISAKIKD